MCGIVGYIGDKKAAPIVHQNLKRLEYRGYDSCGIATYSGSSRSSSSILLKKEVGMIDSIHEEVNLDGLPGNIGIGHTRWATHGGVTKENAHPHTSCNGKIALVHNGIISNYLELKAMLEKKGHRFKSQTDTECIVHLIEEKYDGCGRNIEYATIAALKEIKGTYATIIISADDPDMLICARNESPLLLGIGENEMYVGSDIASFLKHTTKAVPLDDGEYAVVTKSGYRIKDIQSGRELDKEILEIDWSDEAAKKEGYEHFMLKEIHEQPQTIANALNVYPEDIQKLAGMIDEAKTVYMIAAGTSLHAAIVSEYWFSNLCGKVVYAVDSSELVNKGVVDRDTLVISITQSGETYDTLAAMRFAKHRGAKTATIVNVIGSTATRMADHFILQSSGIEISVCATKTFTSQLVILLRTALELARMQGRDVSKIEAELSKCSEYIKEVFKSQDKIKDVAKEHFCVKNYIYIGKGINLPSALEGALKFKEITYNHAEGMSGGLLKHGTISLIDSDMHTVAVIPAAGENRQKMMSNIQEVKARGGVVIGITSGEPVPQCDANILVPGCSEIISPIVFAPAYQLLAYYTAVSLGRNVDKPRALAKSVTVE